MKKIKYFGLILMAFGMFLGNVDAAPTASSGLSYQECNAFADHYRALDGDYYYKSCYRVSCSYGVYNRVSHVRQSGYYCQNGNGTPYVKMDDGCKNFSGSCNTTNVVYCTTVQYVDCNRNADGTNYSQPTTTTKQPTTTTTTKRKTTTKKVTTTRKTTTSEVVTELPTEVKKSSNTNIKQLIIDETEVKVDNEKNDYTIKVPYDVLELPITVVPEDEHSTITIVGNTAMPNEDTVITINIDAEDGTNKKINLNIKRYTGENDDCTLASIDIKNYPIDFEKNTYNYNLKLPNGVKSLDINVIPTDELNATFEIKGNEKLSNKKKIEIVVVAQDGTTCNYVIKVKKINNTWKYIVLIVLLIGGLITTSYFLYKYLKKSKGKYKYE